MATFLPMPSEYDDTLEGLTDEERRRLLEGYAPPPVSTSPMARSARDFTPLAGPRTSPLTPPPPAAGEEDDFMRRFAEAQTRGEWLNGLSSVGSMLDGYARDYAGLSGERNVRHDNSLRDAGTNALLAQRGVARQEVAAKRQQELDGVNLEKTRAETERAKASARATSEEAAREAALARVDSPETEAQRKSTAALLAKNPNVTPALLASLNGLQLRELAKTGTSQINAEVAAQYRADALRTQDENADASRRLQAFALAQGLDIATMTLEQRERLAKMEADSRLAAAEKERGAKLEEREVGGFKFASDRTPSEHAYKKMAEVAAQNAEVRRGVERIRDLYNRHGVEIFGKYAGDAESEFAALTTALRLVNQMGVPNGRDYEMLAKEVEDPTVWKSLATSKERFLAKLDALGKRTEDKVAITAEVYGYERAQKPKARIGTPDNPAPPNPTGYETPDGKPIPIEDLPTGKQTAPQNAPSAPPAKAPSKPAAAVREINIKGMKPGDLKKYLIKEKVPDGMLRLSNGQMANWNGGKLLPVKE